MSGFNSGAIDPALLSGGSSNHNNPSTSTSTSTNNNNNSNNQSTTADPLLANTGPSGVGTISPAQLINHRPTQQPPATLAPALPLHSTINNNNTNNINNNNPSSSVAQTSTVPAPPSTHLASSNLFGASNPSSSAIQPPPSQSSSAPIPPTSSTDPIFLNGSTGPTQATNSNNGGEPTLANGMSSQEHEMHQKDQELAQFLLKMEEYKPVIPDEVAAYYLQRVGFECTDLKVQRLLVLACQKFVSDIAQDAFSYARTRTGQAPGGRQGPLAPLSNSAGLSNGLPNNPGARKDRTRTVLTQEDLAQALAEYGINASRAPYYL